MANIVGIVTTNRESVGGGTPIFFTQDAQQLQQVSHLLEKVLDCAAHQVNDALFIIVNRK
ncbi:MAG: hypothetical protein P0Y55_06395 [Candidatus Cohnella colombiensis]|uniref:Uncharacterized protein n=1 Tax=Candidatus Cohnella colombiensis TaxID=3121368 RepID=A0AA95JBP9_9BACL|nr:MAG: hypothetical protein P0Y55_06395 [Cohnella sp.]